MARWSIVSKASGCEIGVYDGERAADALDAMAREAGHGDHAAACAASGDDGSHLLIQRVDVAPPCPPESDPAAVHAWLCHPDGQTCLDGCDVPADPERLAIYELDAAYSLEPG